jgi:hypothetical protein
MNTQYASSSKIFNLGSNSVVQYRNGTAKSNLVLQFPNLTFQERNVVEVYLSVNHAEIPNSFYLVNSTNNRFDVNGTTYFIPPANYNAINFLNTIQAGILSAFSITGTYDITQNKYTFTSGVAFTIDSSSTCQKFLGLEKQTYAGTSITSTYPLNFLPISRINFHSAALGVSNYNSADNSFDMFLSCQNSSTSGSLILYNNYNALRYDITGLKHISTIDIRVTDDQGNFIDFQNADWSITIRLEYVYLLNPTSTMNFNQIVQSGSKMGTK